MRNRGALTDDVSQMIWNRWIAMVWREVLERVDSNWKIVGYNRLSWTTANFIQFIIMMITTSNQSKYSQWQLYMECV